MSAVGYVRADHVWKRFTLQKDRADSVGQLLVRMLPRRRAVRSEPFWALRDISFEMPQGRSLGIVGHNGAGKSTMLKVLNRTLQPTSGALSIQGRVSALIELGAGFHPDFTGRENVVLNASILGIGRREIQGRMDEIIAFSGIAPFIDTPVKYYSSGMHARLGFSVAIHVDPEILIVDEVLSVGDTAFQQQCMDRIFRLKRAGVSILLVTHSLDVVERLMDDAVWLDHGQVRARGKPGAVVEAYRQAATPTPAAAEGAGEAATAGPRIEEVEVDGTRAPSGALRSGEPWRIRLRASNAGVAAATVFVEIRLRQPDGVVLAQFSGLRDGAPLHLPAGGEVVTSLSCPDLPLVDGSYDVDAALLRPEGGPVHRANGAATFTVTGAPREGLLAITHRWEGAADRGRAAGDVRA